MSNSFIILLIWALIYAAVMCFFDFYKKNYIDNKDEEKK